MTETNSHPIIGRVRINVSTSVKGVKTWDCTVETASHQLLDGTLIQTDIDQALAESDRLVAALDAKYPAPEA